MWWRVEWADQSGDDGMVESLLGHKHYNPVKMAIIKLQTGSS
jgi:hypothetical protein